MKIIIRHGPYDLWIVWCEKCRSPLAASPHWWKAMEYAHEAVDEHASGEAA